MATGVQVQVAEETLPQSKRSLSGFGDTHDEATAGDAIVMGAERPHGIG